ncbi:hypothetical protein GCM10023081_14370 [Arthrobacter ginkgonis]|uniref:ChsH2 rubredoxin-like zinc ribbon domain-containing protein n=1 Tax=Arthrobacter ginkgonis TaxID=1630594 RepID=A0ABP7C5M5_9MICC
MSATIQQCLDCTTLLFPLRLLCPSCGGGRLGPATIEAGTIEHATTLHDGTVLATVRSDGGPALIARLTSPAAAGETVFLTNDPDAGPGHAFVPFTDTPSREDQ